MDASVYVGALSEELKRKRPPLSPHLKSRYGKEFKHALSEDISEAELYRAIGRIAERWEDHQLTLSQALRDVKGEHRNGQSHLTGRTSEDRKRAADDRIRQMMDKGLIAGDPRRPLSKAEERRARAMDDELVRLRSTTQELNEMRAEAV